MDDPAPHSGESDRQRVVVAERNPRVRSTLLLLLSQQPRICVVGEYSTANNLVERLIETRAMILLLDWALAGPNPKHLLRDLRARYLGLAIIALSVRPEPRRQTRCAGADAFVSKIDAPAPFSSR
jgi:DNA-binding NarL/FixJ family response regulator